MTYSRSPFSEVETPPIHMNIASLFSSYRLIASELERERTEHAQTRRDGREERQKLIDAMQEQAGRSRVFDKPPSSKPAPTVAIGPTAAAAKHYKEDKAKEQERLGHQPAIPEVLSE